MLETPLIDSILLGLFRFRTRGFLRLQPAAGDPPPRVAGPCHLYVHIPFCESLCPYCSFHRVLRPAEGTHRYFAALRREIRLYQAEGFAFTGAYFGGGTPTCEPDELVETIGLVRELFGVGEIAVETNPRDLTPRVLDALQGAGVTRLSVGVQSFDNDLLRSMERCDRYGNRDEIIARLRQAVGRFPTLNVDLIFNQPRQSVASFARDLDLVKSLGIDQVSCYPLMTSPSVARKMHGRMGDPSQHRLREFYRVLLRALEPEFTPNSAWCFSRRKATGDEYIAVSDHYVGVGSGAFSYLDGTLHATSFSLPAYIDRVERGRTGITSRHRLSPTERMRYTLLVRFFALGLDRDRVLAQHGAAFFRRLWPEIRSMELLGAAVREPQGWRLTEKGMFWLMLMMSAFFESVNAYRDAMRAQAGYDLGAGRELETASPSAPDWVVV